MKRKLVVCDWYDAGSYNKAFLEDISEELVHRVTFGALHKQTSEVTIIINDYLRNYQNYGCYIIKIPTPNIISLREIGTIGEDD